MTITDEKKKTALEEENSKWAQIFGPKHFYTEGGMVGAKNL